VIEPQIKRVLVASRGEAALRFARAAHARGIEVVALVDLSRDEGAAWPSEIDVPVYVPADARGRWPAVGAVIDVALDAGCDAIYPAWGALVRDADLAVLAGRVGLKVVGPTSTLLSAVADRIGMRAIAEEVGLPVVPGSEPLTDLSHAQTWLAWSGLPAVVRSLESSTAGSGRRLTDTVEAEEVVSALQEVGPVMLERVVQGAREVEVPVIGDGKGGVVALADREITVRDGHVRVLTEAPAPGMSSVSRTEVLAYADALARQLRWKGIGAVRFLVTPDGRPYFLQIRPGVQPWHGATEALLGVDLMDAELRLAEGGPLFWSPSDIRANGHAMALRVRAAFDDEEVGELVLDEGVRFQPALVVGDRTRAGQALGTLIVRAPTRQACIVRARALLDRWPQSGVTPETALLKRLFDERAFWEGPLDREAVAALAAPYASEPDRSAVRGLDVD
jgi:acetyl-CoA carboxylase, biotin carboxylase subunit